MTRFDTKLGMFYWRILQLMSAVICFVGSIKKYAHVLEEEIDELYKSLLTGSYSKSISFVSHCRLLDEKHLLNYFRKFSFKLHNQVACFFIFHPFLCLSCTMSLVDILSTTWMTLHLIPLRNPGMMCTWTSPKGKQIY